MTIDWQVVPLQFHFLQPAVDICGETRLTPFDPILNRHVPFFERISTEQLEALKIVHMEIARKHNASDIGRWCHSAMEGTLSEKKASSRILGILSVLDDLAAHHVSPFCDVPLELGEPTPWDSDESLQLPADLKYLIGPALHFSEQYPNEARMIHFLDEASQQECDLLAAIAQQVRIHGDWPKVLHWQREIGTKHVQYSQAIDKLFNLMDLCDLNFEAE